MPVPQIQTAIPKRRYQFGPYQAVLLGDIESLDPARYRWILALLRGGDSTPHVFITAEKNPRARAADGSHRMRVLSNEMDEEIGSSDTFADLEEFAAAALAVAAARLGLSGITPIQTA